jgi:chitinase
MIEGENTVMARPGILVATLLLLLPFLMLNTSQPAASAQATETAASAKKIVGYYISWAIYGRNYPVTSIPAAKLTHINYAFANIVKGKCAIGDYSADIDRFYTGDRRNALRGNFNQLRKLKETHPHLKVLISVGGWTWSGSFSDVALTPESRQMFVQSCIDLFIKGQYPGIDTPQPGVFDGIDIDWEYPVEGGLEGNRHRPEDKHNYSLLMAEFRSQLDALSKTTGQPYLLSIAAPADPVKFGDNMELDQLSQSLDYINIMTYDYHGAWDNKTNFHAPLYASPDDPSEDSVARTQFNVDQAVQGFLSKGVPPEKIVVGIPFYGRGWQGVPDTNHGLFQAATGPAQGQWDDASSGPTGVFDYRYIKNHFEAEGSGYQKFTDPNTKVPWIYNPQAQIFIAYDDPQSVGVKADYVKAHNLGGVMFWEVTADDGSLLSTIYDHLR